MAGLLDLRDVQAILARTTYRPGWTITAEHKDAFQGIYVSILGLAPDSANPDQQVELRIHSQMPAMLRTEEEFLDWLLWRCTKIEVHEAMEWLQVDGKPFRDPHEAM